MLKRTALLLILCLPAFSQNPNTATFPSQLLTDEVSTVAKDRSVSVLDASIDADDLTLVVDAGHGSRFIQFEIITIEDEQMMVCSVAGDTLTICPGTRGFSWTTAVSHSNGADVSGNYVEWIVNQLNAEMKAVQTLLGINGAGVLRTNVDSTTEAETTITFQPGVVKPGFRVGCGPLPSTPGTGGVLHCNSAAANAPYWYDGTIWRSLSESVTGIPNGGFERTGTNFSIDSSVHQFNHPNLIVAIYDFDTKNEIKASVHVQHTAPYAVSLVSNLPNSRHMWVTIAGWGGPPASASSVTFTQSGTGAITRTVQEELGDVVKDVQFTTFAQACTAAGTTKTLHVMQAWTSLSTQTCAAANIIFFKGASLQPASGATVTIGAFSSGLFKIFDTSLGGFVKPTISTDLNPRWWGAVGDGAADDIKPLQDAVDAAIYGSHSEVHVSAGLYRISRVLHLGYGDTFRSVVLRGDGARYAGSGTFNGTAIIADFSNSAAVNIQGARSSRLREISIHGKAAAWIGSHAMGSLAGATIDDTVGANWVDPALDSRADSRYAPYAGIAIDGYGGTRPATSYPDVTYPFYATSSAQYGKVQSSDVSIENVEIGGFIVGVVIQPSDFDANGDFVRIHQTSIVSCKYAISVGNTQSRNVSIQNVTTANLFVVLTNRVHGRQNGRLNGKISNLSAAQVINLVNFSGAIVGPLTFDHLYAEGLWRIGDIIASTSNETGFEFVSSLFDFGSQNDARGVPATILGVHATAPAGPGSALNISFTGGTRFGNYVSVMVFGNSNTVFDGVGVQSVDRTTGPITPYKAAANNALAGGIVLPAFATPPGQRIYFLNFNQTTGALVGRQVVADHYAATTRTTGYPIYARAVRPNLDPAEPSLYAPERTEAIPKSGLSACSLTDKVLTVTFASRTDYAFDWRGPNNGDVLWDSETGMVFFVRSRTGLTITAEAQNNYKSNGSGGFVPMATFNTGTGLFYSLSSRWYVPTYWLKGNTTAGNPVISAVGRDDGYAAWISEIVVGDRIFVPDLSDYLVGPAGSNVAAVDGTAATITLGGSLVRTETRKQLKFFVRQAPANFP